MPPSPPTDPQPGQEFTPPPQAQPISVWQIGAIGAISLFFMILPFMLGYYAELYSLRIGGIGWEGFFYVLALLPGVIGMTHHIISAPSRRIKAQETLKRYSTLKASTGTGDVSTPEDNTPSVVSACAASLLLTGVFLVVAVVTDVRLAKPRHVAEARVRAASASESRPNVPRIRNAPATPASGQPNSSPGSSSPDAAVGLILAGLGAYVAVLYYMAGRLYANALSSRFLATSALRSASAIALGYVLGLAGIATVLPSANTALAAYFMIGLFHNWAMNAMRTKALSLLGAPKSDNDELPITIVEGVEDTSADLLSEYGVSTVQHLALIDAGDLSERTLVPLDRVLDWTDQAILIQRVKRSVASTRSMGIRTATDFARQYLRKASGDDTAKKLMDSIAEKSGLGAPAVEAIGREFASDVKVQLIYKTLQGTELGQFNP